MTPSHHPPDDWLLAYAAGTLSEAEDLLIAAHCTLCPTCRRAVDDHEQIAGTDLEALAPVPMATGALDAVLGRLGAVDAVPAPRPRPAVPPVLPSALRAYTGALVDVKWKRVMPGIKQLILPIMFDEMPVRLFSLAAGMRIPLHTHEGLERTLVLAGGYSDEVGHFERGDLGIRDGSRDHDQRIDKGETCIALVVAEKPLVPRTMAGRVVSWLTGA